MLPVPALCLTLASDATHPIPHHADSTNTKLSGTRDELQGQKQVFKQSHGLLGTLKRQATMQW